MSAFLAILNLDLYAGRDWFKRQTVSKLIVAGLYLTVLLGVAFGIYFWSNSFFKYLFTYESFGAETALYVLRAAVLTLTWIGILSSLISTLSFLLTSDKHTDLLLTMPISDFLISLRSTIRSLFVNLTLLLVSIFPLLLAYFHSVSSAVGILVLVLFFSQFAGSLLGYLLSLFLSIKHGWYFGAIFGGLIILFTWYIFRQVFPPELKLLSDIPADKYSSLFNSLPLMAGIWSSNQFGVLLVVFTVFLVLFSLTLQKILFIPSWQSAKIHLSSIKKTPAINYKSVSLITKDYLSIMRSPKDILYLLFLLSMMVAFFSLFSRGYLVNNIPDKFRVDALSFSFGWLVFFSGTYLIRLIYPLMINEGQSRWWYFTLPSFPRDLLSSKISVSLIFSLPLLFIALLEWNLLPFAFSRPFLISFSIFSLAFLAVYFPLIGAISPEFRLAYQPENASTSFTGLIAIVTVFMVGLLGSSLISQSLKNIMAPDIALNLFFTFCLVLVLCTGALAVRQIKNLTLD